MFVLYLLLSHHPDIAFTTSLSFDECLNRLRQELQGKREIFGFKYPPPVVERLLGNHFLISRNHSLFYRDNFLVVLEGQFEPTKGGTVVRAWFRLYEGTSLPLVLGIVVFFVLAASGVIVNGAEIGLLLIPVVLWCFLELMIWLTCWVPKWKREGLADYLRSILTTVGNSSN